MPGQVHTSQSDGNPASSGRVTPSSSNASQATTSHSPSSLEPDIAIPSIETESNQALSFSKEQNLAAQVRNPSFSFTPPATGSEATAAPLVFGSSSAGSIPVTTIHTLNEGIGDLRLSEQPAESRVSSRDPCSVPIEGFRQTPGESSTAASHEHPTRSSTVSGIANEIAKISLASEGQQGNVTVPGAHLNQLCPGPDSVGVELPLGTESMRSRRRRSKATLEEPTHSVADEPFPQERLQEPKFQEALTKAKGVVIDLIDVLARSTLHTEPESRIKDLHSQAVDLSLLKTSTTRTVGLVGNTGAGKSSLINSLLDCKLARSSNKGGATTCTATEYHYHEDNGFAIEIQYFSQNELRDQLIKLLRSYRRYHRRNAPGQATVDPIELEDLKMEAKIAEGNFTAVLGGLPAQENLLLDDSPEEVVIQMMLDRLSGLGLPAGEGTDSFWRREYFNEKDKCSERLRMLNSSPASSRESSLWPAIQAVKVYVKAHILSQGLVLVDLPGLQDVNMARVKITERYLLKCDEIFAVCGIGRVTTDPGVEQVFELAKRAFLTNVGIICTKSDDIKAEEAKRDYPGEVETKIKENESAIREAEETVKETEAEIAELIKDPSDEDFQREFVVQHRELKKEEDRLKKTRFTLKQYLITTRNQKIQAKLPETYQNLSNGRKLPIFCVSNDDYWSYRYKPKSIAMPFLNLSGIIELRKHCLSIVAKSQLHAATKYMTNQIPLLLCSIEVWVQFGVGGLSMERKQAILATLVEIENNLDALTSPTSLINASARTMIEKFNELSQTMRQGANEWSQAAREASLKWETWASATYKAFCTNHGDHYTKAVARFRYWNAEAMAAMVAVMTARWKVFEQAIQTGEDERRRLVGDTFNHAISSACGSGVPTEPLKTLANILIHSQFLLSSHLGQIFDDLQRDLRILETDTLSGIRTSIIGELMDASYDTCNRDIGPGSDRRRKNVITGRFSDVELFESLRRRASAKFAALADGFQDKLQESVATHLAAIKSDVDTMRSENAVTESEKHPEFRAQVEEAVARARERMAEVERVARGTTLNTSVGLAELA